MNDKKSETFEDVVEMTPLELRPVTLRLREMILAIDPNSCVVVRLGDRAATFGVGPKKMSQGYVYIMPHSKWVNLGFYKGALLDDPDGLLEGTGAKMRHLKIRSLDECDRPAILELIRRAFIERTPPENPTKSQ